MIGNTATFQETTTEILTAGNLTAQNADVQCLTAPLIKGVEKIGGPGDLLICNDGDLILQPTGDVILSNIAMDFDLTKSILSNVQAIWGAADCHLELRTDPGHKVTVIGGDGFDLAGTDLCNVNDLTANTVQVASKLTTGDMCATQATILQKMTVDDACANTLQTTGDVSIGGNLTIVGDIALDNITSDDITANTVQVAVKLTAADVCVDTLLVNQDVTVLGKLAADDVCGNIMEIAFDATIQRDLNVNGNVAVQGDSTFTGKMTTGDMCADTLLVNQSGTVTMNFDVIGKVTADDICANTIQALVDVTIGNSIVVQGDATVAGKLTVAGLIDPTGLVLDGQTFAPVVTSDTEGLLWVDSSVMPAVLKFGEGGNTHPVLMTDGSTPFTGNLDMNGFEINNVSWVDGRDVAADGATMDAHVGDATIHFTEDSILHAFIKGLGADDHTQYAHLGGRSGGQLLNGGLNADESLYLVPNTADGPFATTGNVVVDAIIDSSDSTSGALIVLGGLGVSKNVIGGQAVAGGFATLAAADAGVTLPDNVMVCNITVGTATAAFALAVPAQTLTGQVLHVYNGTAYATTGVVTAAGAGATLVSDGVIWFQL